MHAAFNMPTLMATAEPVVQPEYVEFNDTTSGGTPIDIRFRTPRTGPVPIQRSARGSGDSVVNAKPTRAEGTGATLRTSHRSSVWLVVALVIAVLAAAAIVYAVVTPTKHKAAAVAPATP